MILLYGDVHGEFRHVLRTVQKEKPAAIVLLGDLAPPKPLHLVLAEVMKLTEVYFIHGNHDSESKQDYENVFCQAMQDRNLHGKILEIDGLKVAGLGGVFRQEIWHPEQGIEVQFEHYQAYLKHLQSQNKYQQKSAKADVVAGKALKHQTSIFYEDWFNLATQACDVLVTHEAPSCHPHGCKAIDELAQAMKAKKTFHGHHHDRLDYSKRYEAMGFATYGVGLRGVSDVNGRVIKPGDLDEQRMFRHTQ